MITEQSFKGQVLAHLGRYYSIKLQIPIHKPTQLNRISLKLYTSPLGENVKQNRYNVLIGQAEDLLKHNIINTQRIKEFGQCFFEIVEQDIMVLESNEHIRRSFTRTRDQIGHRMHSLQEQQNSLLQQCGAIAQRQDILTFLEGSFRYFLQEVAVVSENYDAVNKEQMYTTVHIDSLYNQKITSEDDYLQHYEPLLEVMLRLKSNMLKLYQELNRCEYYELPLRSVNFLANCKNLLIELQPFLIRNDCVFNRLIFYIAKGQKENNRLINKAYQISMEFTNDVVSDIFKSFYLDFIFDQRYLAFKQRILRARQDLVAHFESKTTNYDNFHAPLSRTERILAEITTEINALRSIVGSGKDKIMRQYLGSRQCITIKLLDELLDEVRSLKTFGKQMHQLLRYSARVQGLSQRLSDTDRHVASTLKEIKAAEQDTNNRYPSTLSPKQREKELAGRLGDSFMLIQEGLVVQGQIKEGLAAIREEENHDYFKHSHYPQQQALLESIYKQFTVLQSSMLNAYQQLRVQRSQKGTQAQNQLKKVLQELSDYLEHQTTPEMGFDIKNEDADCERIKDNIIKVQKVEFLMDNYAEKSTKSEEVQRLLFYKSSLQLLLQVYEGSMDEKIFQSFLQKLNFQAVDWKQKVQRVGQLSKQLSRYLQALKAIIRSQSTRKIHQRVFKLVKNRCQLYQILHDMYDEFMLVYQSCKSSGQLNMADNGLRLFDQPTYKYVLMLYQYRNRLRAQMDELRDLLLPKRTLNYLLDEIYEPFVTIFGEYVSYTEEELLNFTRHLEQALNFKTTHQQAMKLYQQTLNRPYSSQLFTTVYKISNELVEEGQLNRKVLQLEDQQVVIYNLNEYKDLLKTTNEYVALAKLIVKELNAHHLNLNYDIRKQTLRAAKTKILTDWHQHRTQIVRVLQQVGVGPNLTPSP